MYDDNYCWDVFTILISTAELCRQSSRQFLALGPCQFVQITPTAPTALVATLAVLAATPVALTAARVVLAATLVALAAARVAVPAARVAVVEFLKKAQTVQRVMVPNKVDLHLEILINIIITPKL